MEKNSNIEKSEKTKKEVVTTWIKGGIFGFGPLVGLWMIFFVADLANHTVGNKILIFLACCFLLGPLWGLLSGHFFWLWLEKSKKEK